ncbi:hypothetical protein [Streptomyces sp. NBC_00687]|uniref:hypothetical protein n=1 Tax=Streptomyces sp. NBC_00687 TaxID=2975807 RepID=UPI00224DFCB9|nr:hypothetical protein [Streptomyces sp. NBC_00687]MCX4919981.1 hypothetical protein [Streptomyces sp. NBC_00687]
MPVAGALALLLAAALAGCTGGESAAGSQDKAAARSPRPSTSKPAVRAQPGGCPALADRDTSPLTKAPKDVQWTIFRTEALPQSKTAGPAVTERDLTRCYAHTPTGALIAAVQISTRSMLASNWTEVWEKQTYGPDKDATLKALRMQFGSGSLGTPDPGELGQVAGFHFVTYNDDTAVIEVLMRYPDGSLQVAPETVRWHHGDWQVEINENAQRRTVKSAAGFVSWGGI